MSNAPTRKEEGESFSGAGSTLDSSHLPAHKNEEITSCVRHWFATLLTQKALDYHANQEVLIFLFTFRTPVKHLFQSMRAYLKSHQVSGR